MNKYLISVALIALFGVWSCSSDDTEIVENTNNETKLGLIDSDVQKNNDDLAGMPTYSDSVPGTSLRVERAFENAPPMIPHSVEGLVPITMTINTCTSCHLPEVAIAMESTAMPESHFTNYRPEVKLGDGTYDIATNKDVTQQSLQGKLNMARYNCTQCHVTQANVDLAIENTFKAVYRKSDLNNKSNLSDNITEGVR
ncbi:MAG: nitrate reductase cytochrome c-type subunit [Bacteroidales bacterium]|nr:nitrate reductase cytochrome c-type subunit [Bacteroidales bacterium]